MQFSSKNGIAKVFFRRNKALRCLKICKSCYKNTCVSMLVYRCKKECNKNFLKLSS